MWYAIIDWGLGMKDGVAKDEDLWPVLSAIEKMPTNIKTRLKESKGEAVIQVFYIPSEAVYVEPEYFMY